MTRRSRSPRPPGPRWLLSVLVSAAAGCAPLGASDASADGPIPPPPAAPAPDSVSPFADGFEQTTTLGDLFPADGTRWHGIQRDPPENGVDLSTEQVRSGERALRFTSGPNTGAMVPKANIHRRALHFRKGDDVWFSGWYYLVGGPDASDVFLWDLEDSRALRNPGRRLYLQAGGHLASDLGKTPSGPKFRQARDQEIPLPRDRWVHIRIHLYLSDDHQGTMTVWQDGVRVIDGRGATLPSATSVYDRLQVGLTANGGHHPQTLYVDDIVISRQATDVPP